jgi:hypothetical protein
MFANVWFKTKYDENKYYFLLICLFLSLQLMVYSRDRCNGNADRDLPIPLYRIQRHGCYIVSQRKINNFLTHMVSVRVGIA